MKRYIPIAKRTPTFTARQKCYIFDDPSMACTIVSAGPEQSEVKFPNGNVNVVCNSWLTPFDKETS